MINLIGASEALGSNDGLPEQAVNYILNMLGSLVSENNRLRSRTNREPVEMAERLAGTFLAKAYEDRSAQDEATSQEQPSAGSKRKFSV